MKKCIALLLVTVIVFSLFAGCGNKVESTSTDNMTNNTANENETGTRKDINVAITADPGTMSPYIFGGPDYNKVIKSVYQTLAFLTLEKELQPIIAEKWEQIDSLTYVVKIKENVHDSNNNPIDANDVYFSCQQHMESSQKAAWKYSDDTNPVEVTGDYELTFHFKQETSSAFTSLLTSVNIVSEKSFTESPDQFVNTPVGTGPYKLENWVVGSVLTLTQNENYWDDNPYKYFVQNMESITYKIIAESAQRAVELETGGVDLIYDSLAGDLKRLDANPDYVANAVEVNKVLNIYFNCTENSICSDKRLRQAVAYAIDSQALVIAACEGLGTAAPSIAHPVSKEWRSEYEGKILYPQDLDKAKALMEELKADGLNPDFSIMTDENATKNAAAAIIQEACKQIGINVEIEQLESAVFQSRYGDMSAWDTYIGLGGSSALYTMSTLVTQIDRTGYPNPSELREAVDIAFTKYDDKTSDEAISLWDEEIPILTLVFVQSIYIYRDGLKGAEQLDYSGMIHPGACSWE